MADERIVRDKLRTYICAELIKDEDYELEDDESIISDGLMDSFSLAELGVYIDEEFSVFIPDPDLTVDKMDTLDQIVARVMKDID